MNRLFIAALLASLVSADIGLEYNKKFGFSSDGSQGIPHLKFGSNHGYSGGLSGDFEGNLHGNHRGYPHLYEQNTFYPPPIPPPLPPSVYFVGTSTPSPVAYHQRNTGGQYFSSGESSNILDSHRVVSIPRTQFNGATYQHQQAYHAGHQLQTTNQHQPDNVKHQFQYTQSQQPPQVFKHFYVHVAPEEPEPPKRQQTITLPPPQKHYKIIFIKAPTFAAPPPQIIAVPQQNEEKTIVYVLLKKPEESHQAVQLPKIEAKPPAKPEVFFIKYNNKDGQSVINNIVNDYSKVETVTFAGPEQTGQYLGTQTGASKQKTSNDDQYAHLDESNYIAIDTNKYATDSNHKNDNSLSSTSNNAIKYTGSIGYTGAIGLANKFGGDASSSASQASSSQTGNTGNVGAVGLANKYSEDASSSSSQASSSQTGNIGYTGAIVLSNKFSEDASSSSSQTSSSQTGNIGYTGAIGLADKFDGDASNSQTSSGQTIKDSSTISQVSVNKSSGDQKINTLSPIIASLSSAESQESQTTYVTDGQIANTFSLNQHVPHETYGPPKFRSS